MNGTVQRVHFSCKGAIGQPIHVDLITPRIKCAKILPIGVQQLITAQANMHLLQVNSVESVASDL